MPAPTSSSSAAACTAARRRCTCASAASRVAGAREGLCRAATPPASMPAACGSSAATSPRSRCRSRRWSCGTASAISSTTIAASSATGRCMVAETEEELDEAARPRRRAARAGFTPRGTDRSRGTRARWCPAVGRTASAASSRAATAPPIPSAPRSPSGARPRALGATVREGVTRHRAVAAMARTGVSRPAAGSVRGAVRRQRRGRLGRPHRRRDWASRCRWKSSRRC